MNNRQYYLDWIRVGTILLVFFFHCGRFFDYSDWHVKNATLSPAINFFIFSLVEWIMPMFFFISGASTWFALGAKSNAAFITDRTKRILIPLLLGIFILSPHQVYLERLTHHQFSGSFINFMPHYFSGWYAFGGNFAWMGLHLWYLLLLFVFSLLTLPLFRMIKRRPSLKVNLGLYLAGAIFLLALPGSLLIPRGFIGMRVWGGWNILEHLFLFMLGYYTCSRKGIIQYFSTCRYAFLAACIALTSVNLYFFVYPVHVDFGSSLYLIGMVLRAMVCLSWIFTIVGFAARYLNYTNSKLKYGNEAVLPFYILHQPVIVLIGYFVVQWPISIGFKYGIIALSSFLIIAALYLFLVRRIGVLRFLLGMGKANKGSISKPYYMPGNSIVYGKH